MYRGQSSVFSSSSRTYSTVGNVIFQPPSSSPAADHVLHHHFLLPLNQHPDKNNEIEKRLGTSPGRGLRSHKGVQL